MNTQLTHYFMARAAVVRSYHLFGALDPLITGPTRPLAQCRVNAVRGDMESQQGILAHEYLHVRDRHTWTTVLRRAALMRADVWQLTDDGVNLSFHTEAMWQLQ